MLLLLIACDGPSAIIGRFRRDHPIEDVLRDPLDPDVVAQEIAARRILETRRRRQDHVPPARSGVEDQGALGGGVERRGIGAGALLAVGAVDRPFREHDEIAVLAERWTVVLPAHQLGDAIALPHARPPDYPE